MKQATRYQVREFVGNQYSKQLGRRLRTYKDAARLVRTLRAHGRDVYTPAMRINTTC